MDTSIIINARRLADYITNDLDLDMISPKDCFYKNHIAALFTDIILQSGMNYNFIVAPRINYILKTYPNVLSIKQFTSIIATDGIENIMKWNHPVKLQRMLDLLLFCRQRGVNTSNEIRIFLSSSKNQEDFLTVKGIGNKTLDYLLKLLNTETVAVDRHIFSYVEKAGIESKDYKFVKLIVEYAADIIGVSRRTMDYSIWYYMSDISKTNKQLSRQFSSGFVVDP